MFQAVQIRRDVQRLLFFIAERKISKAVYSANSLMADLRAYTDRPKNQERTALTEINVRTDSVSTEIEKRIGATLKQLAVAASAAFSTPWVFAIKANNPSQGSYPKTLNG